MKKFKDLYVNLAEYAEDYPPGWSDGSDKRRVDGDSFGGFRVGEGNVISRINSFLNKYLSGSYLAGDHKLVLRELRVRLNHIGLDFDSEKELVEGQNRIKVKLHGDTFGTTPTTDLMKGFDRGEDLPTLTLVLNYTHDKNTGLCFLSGNLSADGSVNEEKLNEFAPLLAALPTIAKVASTVGTVASAAGAVKDLISPNKPEMGEDGMSKRSKRIKYIGKVLEKKKLNENPLIPILIGAGRVIAPVIAGEVLKKAFSSEEKPTEVPSEKKEEPPVVPYSLAGKSNLGRFDRLANIRKSRVKPVIDGTARVISESKDEPRVVEHHIMRDKNIKEKVLQPIYTTLKKLKMKNKYNKDVAAKHLYYVVNYAIRDLNKGNKKVTLSQIEKARVVNDLVRNFEKLVK